MSVLRRARCCVILLQFLFISGALEGAEVCLNFEGRANRSFAELLVDTAPIDLKDLVTGEFRFAGIGFRILDGNVKGEGQLLVFDSTSSTTLREACLFVDAKKLERGSTLYLLHTAPLDGVDEHQKIGQIMVDFDSGKKMDYSIMNGRELADWRSLSAKENGAIAYKITYGFHTVGLYFSKFSLPKFMGHPVSIRFARAENASWIIVAATISDHDVPLPSPEKWKAQVSADWRLVDLTDRTVVEGSALDMSALFEPGKEAGSSGPVIVNEQGKLAFQGNPAMPVRFLCYSEVMTTKLQAPEVVASYAQQIKRAGYNMLRCHFLDHFLMVGSVQDLAINPERLDQWDRFAAELKKNGIYLYIDASTSWAAYYAVPEPWSAKARALKLKSRIYYDTKAQEHWKKAVTQLFEHVNPYTGMALKDDPQVAIVQTRNESGLNFLMYLPNSRDPDLVIPFRKWLRSRYGSMEALRKAWGAGAGFVSADEGKQGGEGFDLVALPAVSEATPAARDLQRFFVDLEQETFLLLSSHLREIGVKSLILDYNNEYSMQSTLTRDVLPLIDSHAYHDHPTDFTRAGSRIRGDSATKTGLSYFRSMAGLRHWGAPFVCSEWGHSFWQPWRHEAGLSIPAYAALQGWQMIAQFSNPIGIKPSEPIVPFRILRDPPLRAAEYMSVMLYRRGDVTASPHAIAVELDPQTVFDKLRPQNALPGSITELALIAGIGVKLPSRDGAAPRAPQVIDYVVKPETGSSVSTGQGAQEVSDEANARQSFGGLVDDLKKKKIIPENNQTDQERGVYQSDTGELILSKKESQLRVVTKYSEGVSLPACSKPVNLSRLQVENLGSSSLTCFVGSLTKESIHESTRLLLILVSDALNENMTFEDDTRRKLVSLGGPEVLARVVKAKLQLQTQHASTLRLFALSANGKRLEELDLHRGSEAIEVSVDTGALKAGPASYFELVVRSAGE